MAVQFHYNDAWDSIPPEFVEETADYIREMLQPHHPLKNAQLYPFAKCWRKSKYALSDENDSDPIWIIDFHRKKRVKGRTCYYFAKLEKQSDIDSMLNADYDAWVQYMKDAGAWNDQ